MTYKICTACTPNHYENCGTCFGFGLHANGMIVSAGQASSATDDIPCPECGSTRFGVPVEEAFKRLVLDSVSDDILLEPTAGWVFWQWGEDHGFLEADALRVIADELDRRNKELFE